ncbi:hypothetical protein K8942_00530 [Candidatus Peribacteria bacterium]|nr:MAG: hypothetical protein K8942_00530 [Candidatus Peribacteria bacterium]
MSDIQSTTKRFRFLHRVIGLCVVLSGLVTLNILVQNDEILARIIRKPVAPAWLVLEEDDILLGATIPPDTNVVFHLPFDFTSINRQVLLGLKGTTARYWGYCFPQNYDPTITSKRVGFPGLMFLSEKERAVRRETEARNKPQYSLQNLPTKTEAETMNDRVVGSIRHQIETFQPGTMCYIMADTPMAIGLDPDQDGVNDKIEIEIGTDKNNPDSDGDGVVDGTEFTSATSPTLRDTDGDGIIDGIEDTNWNGRPEMDETDPRIKDTDRDGLCDGMCRIRLSNGQQLYAGEDKNLDGEVDSDETDPLKVDSKNDGYGDYQRFLKCIFDGKSEC